MNLSRASNGQLMAVQTLKINFGNFVLILTNPKFISVNCKSVSVITGPLSFLPQPKIIWLAVLSFNYWSFDFNATRFRKKFFKVLDIFVLLVPFEILSHYLNNYRSHWLGEDVQWMIDQVFRNKRMV